MKEKLDKIEVKVDGLDNRLDRQTIVLTEMAADLKYHIKRSDRHDYELVEHRKAIEKFAREQHSIKEHVDRVKNVPKQMALWAGIAGTVIGMTYTLLRIL